MQPGEVIDTKYILLFFDITIASRIPNHGLSPTMLSAVETQKKHPVPVAKRLAGLKKGLDMYLDNEIL